MAKATKKIERAYYNPVVERMSREELLAFQWRRLKGMLERVYHTNPFYRQRMDEAKAPPDKIKTMEDFRRIPILVKKDLIKDQEAQPPFGTRLGTEEKKLVFMYMTSGTTGMGQEVYGVSRGDIEYGANWAPGLYWAGMRAGETCINTLPTNWSYLAAGVTLTMSINKLRALQIPLDVTVSWERKAQIMKRFNPHFAFMVDPFRMAKVFAEQGIDPKKDFPRLHSLYLIFAGGWSVETITRIEDYWGTKSYNMYGLTQGKTGTAFTCENGMVHKGKHGMYHWIEDVTLFEVVNRETREPVKPGEEGELVVTTLNAEASPVIRFGTADRVVLAPHNYCNCGRPYAGLMVGSLHRYDDMMKLRGINVWPEAVDMLVFAHEEIVEYLGRVSVDKEGKEQVFLTLEFKKDIPEAKKKELLALVPVETRDKVGIRMDCVEADKTLPRWEFKARRWTDERVKGLQRIAF